MKLRNFKILFSLMLVFAMLLTACAQATPALTEAPAPDATEEPALAGFSIGRGRLAWVGPEGVNGEGSQIHVAAWVGRDVGTAESAPGAGIVVVR